MQECPLLEGIGNAGESQAFRVRPGQDSTAESLPQTTQAASKSKVEFKQTEHTRYTVQTTSLPCKLSAREMRGALQMGRHTPVTPAAGRLSQMDQEFKASLGYEGSRLTKQQQNGNLARV